MNIGQLIATLGFDTAGLKKGTQEFTRSAQEINRRNEQMSGSFDRLKNQAIAFFSGREIVRFTLQVAELAGEVTGVRTAFDRISSPGLLNELQTATKKTASEFALMKAAVSANNFEIPLKELGTLLKFAKTRATETGQSVEYLTNSIVYGIGRKSPLILDNLGISAIKLKERLNGVAVQSASIADVTKVVGTIAREELAKAGESAQTSAEKTQQLTAEFENLKVILGTKVNTLFLDDIKEKLIDLTERAQTFFKGFQTTVRTTGIEELRNSLKGLSGDDFTAGLIKQSHIVAARLKLTQQEIEMNKENRGILDKITKGNVAIVTPMNAHIKNLEKEAAGYGEILNYIKNILYNNEKRRALELEINPPEPPKVPEKDASVDTEALTKAHEKLQARLETALVMQKVYGKEFDILSEKTSAYKTAIQDFISAGLKPENAEIQDLIMKLKVMQQIPFELPMGIEKTFGSFKGLPVVQKQETWLPEDFGQYPVLVDNLTNSLEKMNLKLFDSSTAFKEITNTLLMIGADSSGLLDFAKNAISASKKIISAYIAQGVAASVKSALENTPFPFNIIAAGLAGGAAAALFNKLVPSFAEGGVVKGPMLAMVGDNPSKREAIVPLEKANQFGFGRGNNTTRVTGELKLSKKALWWALHEYEETLSNT